MIFVLFDPYFFLFPPLRSLVSGYVIKDAVEENYESDHDSRITEYAVPSLALNYHGKKYQIIYESVYIVIFVYTHEKQILMQE